MGIRVFFKLKNIRMTEFTVNDGGCGVDMKVFVCPCSRCEKKRMCFQIFRGATNNLIFCSQKCVKKSTDKIKTFMQNAVCCQCEKKLSDPNCAMISKSQHSGTILNILHCSVECNALSRRQISNSKSTKLTAKCVCDKEMQISEKEHKKCGKCKTKLYCSRECQIKDWPDHKKDCKES